jgi:hypothetical protein
MLGPKPLLVPHIQAAVLRPLRAGLEARAMTAGASASVALAWLDLLASEQKRLWGELPEPAPLKAKGAGWLCERLAAARQVTHYLDGRWGDTVRPTLELLRDTGDVRIVRRALDQKAFAIFRWWHGGRSSEVYHWVLGAGATLEIEKGHDSCCIWGQLCRLADAGERARTAAFPLLTMLRKAPSSTRFRLLEAIETEIRSAGRDQASRRLRGMQSVLPTLLRFRSSVDYEPGTYVWGALLHVASVGTGKGLDCLLQWLRSVSGSQEAQRNDYSLGSRVRCAVDIAFALGPDGGGEDTADRFRSRLAALISRLDGEYLHDEALPRALPLLDRFPALRAPLSALIEHQTTRCLRFLARLGSADYAGSDGAPLSPLADLDPGIPMPATGVCVSDDPEWTELLALAPDLAPTVAAYWYACYLLGVDDPPVPPGVRRTALDGTAKLARELAYLEEKGDPADPGIAARQESLRARLADTKRLRTLAAEEARERLTAVTHEAQMAASERLLMACYSARLGVLLARPVSPAVVFDDDLYNAVRLGADLKTNRKLLRRLLRAHVAGPGIAAEFVRRHPRNREFLAVAAERGVDTKVWLGENPCVIRLPVSGARVRLRLESDPLRILQMGNPFGTCLSAGAFNAFSTVTNACELNKRVLFAEDAASGRIVGRKLIGLTEDLALLGFHTYTSVNDATDGEALRTAIRRHLLDFAARCHLIPADTGTIPRLFAEDWYDTGPSPGRRTAPYPRRAATMIRRGGERWRRQPTGTRS